MKIDKKNILGLILIFQILGTIGVYSQAIYNLTPEDDRFLQYLDFRNTFTYSGVKMRFGEVTVRTASQTERVNLVEWDTPDMLIQDKSGQGDQVDLLQYSRTENFKLESSQQSEISFLRNIGMWAPSNAFPPQPDDPAGGGPDNTPWDISDKTEFEIQLRDADTENLIMVLNTAGIDQHSDPYSNPWYGDQPKEHMFTVQIPIQHAGKNVYVQVVTRRWGPSPYGITMMKESGFMLNEASLLDSDGNLLSDTQLASLHDDWFQEVLNYCDEVKSTTGWLPPASHWTFSPARSDLFLARYFEDEIINGQSVTVELPPPPGFTKSLEERESKFKVLVSALVIRSVSPNPIEVGDVLSIEVEGRSTSQLTIALFSMQGRKISELWTGMLSGEQTLVKLDFSNQNIAAGVYSLAILDTVNQGIISQSTITILK